jgi:hypothetical protein
VALVAGVLLIGVTLVRGRPPAHRAADPARTLAQGLTGYWRFDDGPGSRIARDHSGVGADCQMRRNADPASDWVPGRLGGGLAMNARGWLECPATAFQSRISNEMTVAAWVRKNPEQGSLRALITRQHGDASLDDFLIGFQGRDVIVASHRWHGHIRFAITPTTGWLHLAATFDHDGTTRLFLDGREVAHGSGQPASVAGGDNPLVIGGSFNGGRDANQRFQGAIDELLLYQRALSPAEISALAAGLQPRL